MLILILVEIIHLLNIKLTKNYKILNIILTSHSFLIKFMSRKLARI